MALKHAFNSIVSDEVSPSDRVQPSHWNADHVLSNFMRATYATGSGLPTGAGFDVRNSASQGLWYVQLTDEDGNFTLQRRDPSASGTVIGTPLKIVRDTGVATFEQIALPSYSNVKTTLDTLSTAVANRPKMLKDDTSSYRCLGGDGATSTSSAAFVNNGWRYNKINVIADIAAASLFTNVASPPSVAAGHYLAAALYDADPSTGMPLNRLIDLGLYDVTTSGVKNGPTGVNIPAGEYYLVYATGSTNSTSTGNVSFVAQLDGMRFALGSLALRRRFEATGPSASSGMPTTIPGGLTWVASSSALSLPIFFKV